MEELTQREEDIMHALWKLKKAFVKEIQAELSTKFHYNTVSTVVRKLESKGFIGHESFGNTHRYHPLTKKGDYQSYLMKSASDRFFNSSYKNMVSFFAKEEKINAQELREILDYIENKSE